MSEKQYETNQLNRLKNSKYGFNIIISDYEGNSTNNMRLTERLVTGLKILLDDNEEYLLYIKDCCFENDGNVKGIKLPIILLFLYI